MKSLEVEKVMLQAVLIIVFSALALLIAWALTVSFIDTKELSIELRPNEWKCTKNEVSKKLAQTKNAVHRDCAQWSIK